MCNISSDVISTLFVKTNKCELSITIITSAFILFRRLSLFIHIYINSINSKTIFKIWLNLLEMRDFVTNSISLFVMTHLQL